MQHSIRRPRRFAAGGGKTRAGRFWFRSFVAAVSLLTVVGVSQIVNGPATADTPSLCSQHEVYGDASNDPYAIVCYGNESTGTVSFDATQSTGTGPFNYYWDFGDGTYGYSYGETPAHVYAASGTYDVDFTISNANTQAFDEVDFQVDVTVPTTSPPPQPDAPTANPLSVSTIEGQSITFDATQNVTGGASSQYTLVQPSGSETTDNGSLTVDGNEVTYTPDQGFTGTDSFTRQVSDGTNVSNTEPVDITVNSMPPPVVKALPVKITSTPTCPSPRSKPYPRQTRVLTVPKAIGVRYVSNGKDLSGRRIVLAVGDGLVITPKAKKGYELDKLYQPKLYENRFNPSKCNYQLNFRFHWKSQYRHGHRITTAKRFTITGPLYQVRLTYYVNNKHVRPVHEIKRGQYVRIVAKVLIAKYPFARVYHKRSTTLFRGHNLG